MGQGPLVSLAQRLSHVAPSLYDFQMLNSWIVFIHRLKSTEGINELHCRSSARTHRRCVPFLCAAIFIFCAKGAGIRFVMGVGGKVYKDSYQIPSQGL